MSLLLALLLCLSACALSVQNSDLVSKIGSKKIAFDELVADKDSFRAFMKKRSYESKPARRLNLTQSPLLRPDLREIKTVADHDEIHEIHLIVRPLDENLLHRTLNEVSDPKSSKYGQFLSHKDVKTIVRNELAVESVTNYLNNHNIEIIRIDKLGYTITCRATIKTWERIFETKFHQYEMKVEAGDVKTLNRAKSYNIPLELKAHLLGAFGLVDFPARKQKKLKGIKQVKRESFVTKTDATTGVTTYCSTSGSTTECYVGPETINTYYNIDSNVGDPYEAGNTSSSFVDQAVYASIGQIFSTVDLEAFQTEFNLPKDAVDEDKGGHKSAECETFDDCTEANLDVQYMLAISQETKMIYDYVASAESFSAWLATVANLENPYDVISISYGESEKYLTDTELYSFETSAQILGVQGVTLFSSSGDDGVAGSGTELNSCGYHPQFPASCPIVTSVGATMGPESNSAEIVCSGATGGVITSGGGFSDYYSMPEWQSDVVNSYISNTQPYAGYNSKGRAYPDISLLGYNYLVAIQSEFYLLSGTSASSPVFAAMISLINARRKSLGRSRVGWINPALYSLYEDDPDGGYVIDITEGDNSCTAYGNVCCEQGFPAAVGWDGSTGLGSVDFGILSSLMQSLGNTPLYPTSAPTPTAEKTTSLPTKEPTASPTQDSGYLFFNSYLGDVCEDDPYYISAYRTGLCLQEQTWKYQNEPLDLWVKFECTSNGGYFKLYRSNTCEADLFYEGLLSSGCSYSDEESFKLTCESSGDRISLPTMTDYTYEVGYNDDNCETIAMYDAYMEDYCFVYDTNSSIILEWPNRYSYANDDCAGTPVTYALGEQCQSNEFENYYYYYLDIYGFYALKEYSYAFGHSAATYSTYKPTAKPTDSPSETGTLAITLSISGFSGDMTDPDTQQAVLLAIRDVSGLDDSDSLEIIDTYRRRLLRILSTDVTVEMGATVYLSNHPSSSSISDVEANIALAIEDAVTDGSLNAALINECTGTCGTSFDGATISVTVSSIDSNGESSSDNDAGISGGEIAAIVIFVLLAVSSTVAYIIYRSRKAAKDSSALKSFEISEVKTENPMQLSAVNVQTRNVANTDPAAASTTNKTTSK